MIRIRRLALAALACAAVAMVLFASVGLAQEMPQPPRGASLRFLEPANGAKMKSPVTLRFVAEGIKTVPAGAVEAGAGHHHVIVDALPPEFGQVIPADGQHLHFGKAQTDAQIELKPGLHTLTLQFADGLHRSYGPSLSRSIIIEVTP
jgi:hypothetical protein